VIPLGTQTFSKSHQQFPEGHSPLFLERGEGGRVWDVDGNEFVDLICGLLPVVLGYRDPDVDAAVRAQLERGVSFSLATTLELDLAERLVATIPCADMVRFGKNGSDATSAAVRLARAATGRDHVLAIGYHGWQDWYIGATTRCLGVPEPVRRLTHKLPYNDLNAVQAAFAEYRDEIAAVILEPMNTTDPAAGYLEELASYCRNRGTVFIFDEIITGYRFAVGGAQDLFGVTPDLACFGKGMANGLPISAVVGRGDLMRLMEEVFYSSTFGGEALSIAAAIAVIDKMVREPVIERLWRTGAAMAARAQEAIAVNGLNNVIALTGKDPWRILAFNDHPHGSKEAIKTVFLREMLAAGVLTAGAHNICYAHNDDDVERVGAAYAAAAAKIAEALSRPQLDDRLDVPVIRPVFAVRA
jgi:glutamate-1-semialdehyde 2,1-aminomutase/spore coat polysaccharide biosynthesis protein SpsF